MASERSERSVQKNDSFFSEISDWIGNNYGYNKDMSDEIASNMDPESLFSTPDNFLWYSQKKPGKPEKINLILDYRLNNFDSWFPNLISDVLEVMSRRETAPCLDKSGRITERRIKSFRIEFELLPNYAIANGSAEINFKIARSTIVGFGDSHSLLNLKNSRHSYALDSEEDIASFKEMLPSIVKHLEAYKPLIQAITFSLETDPGKSKSEIVDLVPKSWLRENGIWPFLSFERYLAPDITDLLARNKIAVFPESHHNGLKFKINRLDVNQAVFFNNREPRTEILNPIIAQIYAVELDHLKEIMEEKEQDYFPINERNLLEGAEFKTALESEVLSIQLVSSFIQMAQDFVGYQGKINGIDFFIKHVFIKHPRMNIRVNAEKSEVKLKTYDDVTEVETMKEIKAFIIEHPLHLGPIDNNKTFWIDFQLVPRQFLAMESVINALVANRASLPQICRLNPEFTGNEAVMVEPAIEADDEFLFNHQVQIGYNYTLNPLPANNRE